MFNRTTFRQRASLRATFSSSTPLRAPPSPNPIARKSKATAPNLEDYIDLPDQSQWRSYFPLMKVKDRISVSNPHTAAKIAENFVPEGSKGKVIIEAFPGPGALTRALLALPKHRIRKLIVLEDNETYLKYLHPLAGIDPRIMVFPLNGFQWDAYQFLDSSGALDDVTPHRWEEGPHPHLQFISHLPQITMGEQFIAQALRCIPDRSWLFQYGRVPLNMVLSEWVWSRLSADVASSARCKLTVIAEATATTSTSLPAESLVPFSDHFHPATPKIVQHSPVPENRRIGLPFVAVGIQPLKQQVIHKDMLDKWDYCLRRLFVMRSTPLKTAISHLAPGAGTLVKTLTKPELSASRRLDVTKRIRDLTVHDWALLLQAFDEWPFAPEDLMVTDGFKDDARKLG